MAVDRQISIAAFQSTHPRGVRLSRYRLNRPAGWFQSTHPRGVRLVSCVVAGAEVVFQSTHPRGVRPSSPEQWPGWNGVSIHAPTRGATCLAAHFFEPADVSIHAPTRGATAQYTVTADNGQVSIHAPTRGATFIRVNSAGTALVSIHAPTRGATTPFRVWFISCTFQSTHPRGVRPILWMNSGASEKFQSTHPRGVRPLGSGIPVS